MPFDRTYKTYTTYMSHGKTTLFALALLLLPGAVFAQYGLQDTATAADLIRTETPAQIAGNVIGAGLSMIGVLFFLLMVYSGILWMTARGNEEQTKKALNTAIAAGIGMVIVLASYAITSFVFKAAGEGPLGPTAEDGG